jgi:hypothetical protein
MREDVVGQLCAHGWDMGSDLICPECEDEMKQIDPSGNLGKDVFADRDLNIRPYNPDELRVVEYLEMISDGIGPGFDPIGFLIASHAMMRALADPNPGQPVEPILVNPVEVRMFPILLTGLGGISIPTEVPWGFVAEHGEQAKKNHYQSLETLASRGGLSWGELLAVLEDRAGVFPNAYSTSAARDKCLDLLEKWTHRQSGC